MNNSEWFCRRVESQPASSRDAVCGWETAGEQRLEVDGTAWLDVNVNIIEEGIKGKLQRHSRCCKLKE